MVKKVTSSIIVLLGLFFLAGIFSCQPEEPIEFKYIRNVAIDLSAGTMLRGEAVLHNPNKMKIKLRKIKVDIYVDGKKSGEVDQKLNFMIPAKQEFAIPLEIKISMQEIGLKDALIGILGGKTMDVHY